MTQPDAPDRASERTSAGDGGAAAPVAPDGGETSASEAELGAVRAGADARAAKRAVRIRRFVIVGLLGGVGALFAWSPGGGEAEPAFEGEGDRATTVSVGEAESDSLVERSTYPGELVADRADLASKIGGRIREVNVRTGAEVERGQILARIDASDLRAQLREAQAQVESAQSAERRAQVELEAAERDLERNERLAERDVVSQQDVDDVRDRVNSLQEEVQSAVAERSRAEAQIEVLSQDIQEAEIKAPFAGTVSERHVDPGAFVQSGSPVVRLVSGAPLRVSFEVPERDVGAFGEGAEFEVRAPPTGDQTFMGTVTGAAREVVREQRVAHVEGTVVDAPQSWLAGMYAEVVTPRRSIDDALVVPESALVSRVRPDGETRYGLFRPRDGHARWLDVRVLGREDGRVAVEGELEEGARILVSGHRELGDGQPISILGAGEEDEEAAADPSEDRVTGELGEERGRVAEEEDRSEGESADDEGGA